MDIQDFPAFAKLLAAINKSFRISEKQLIKKCEVLKPGETKKLARAHLGLNFKRLLSRHQIGKHAGELLTNNLEKEFARGWVYMNNKSSGSNRDKKYLTDMILGRTATDDELIIASTMIQWLGTSVGMNFIESVTGVEFVKNVGEEKIAA